MERFDVAVVGAGPAGCAAAITAAKAGLTTLLAERAKAPGQKNVFGGRIYSYALRKLFPDFPADCPVERWVTREVFTFMTETDAFSLDFEAPRFANDQSSFTAVRNRFDKWMAERAAAAGVMLVGDSRIDDLWRENGRVVGLVAAGDKVRADVVIAADGALSQLARKAGLRPDLEPKALAVGVKEVIELPLATLEDRFHVEGNEGTAQVFAGYASQGLRGGGFLYTNKSSVALGLVVGSDALSTAKTEIPAVLDRFKAHPAVHRLLKGGKLLEYSAHLIPESTWRDLPVPYTDGFLVAGDAGGFLINNGYSFRGVDLAVLSGLAAGEAAKAAKDRGDVSAAGLAVYEQRLRAHGIRQDLETFGRAPDYLRNPRLYDLYPRLLCEVAERVYRVDGTGKGRLSDVALEELKGKVSVTKLLADLVRGARSM